MNTRSTGLKWLKENHPELQGKNRVSKLYLEAESWSKSKVWWFEFPESDVTGDISSYQNLLCNKHTNSEEFYLVRVPNSFLIEFKSELYLRDKKSISTYSIYLSASPEDMYVEQRGKDHIEFGKFFHE